MKFIYAGNRIEDDRIIILDYMTEEEAKLYVYLLSEDRQKAKAFLKGIQRTLDNRRAIAEETAAMQEAKDNPVLGTVKARGANLITFPGAIEGVYQSVSNAISGEDVPINTDSQSFSGIRLRNAYDEGVHQRILQELGDNLASQMASSLYDAGAGFADEALPAVLAPGFSKFTAPIQKAGNTIDTWIDYAHAIEKAMRFPTPCDKSFPVYYDWITDLDWLNATGFSIIIDNYSDFMSKDLQKKDIVMKVFEEDVLPWWQKDVENHVVEGQAKSFNVYLVE